MNRRNQILAGVLVLQLVVAVIAFVPRLTPATSESKPLLTGLTADKMAALSVTDNAGKSIDVGKQDGAWVLPKVDAYPASQSKIDSTLEQLAGLKTGALVARPSASHKQLQVADNDYQRKIDIQLTDGTTQTVYFGASSGGASSYVRVGGQDDVYLAQGVASFDFSTDPTGWIETTYLSVTQDSIISVKIENANGTFEFNKDAQNNWTMSGLSASEQFNSDSLVALLSRLSSLALSSPLGKQAKPEYGMDKPSATVTLAVKDPTGITKSITLRIGAKDSTDNSYVVISSESPYYVRVSGFQVDGFVTQTREKFLATPTPAPTSEAPPAVEVTPTAEVTPTLEVTPSLEVTPELNTPAAPTDAVQPPATTSPCPGRWP